MTTCDSDTLQYRRLRAPRAHGEVLLEPAAGQWAARVSQNIELRQAATLAIFGDPLDVWALQARRELLTRARDYTALYRPASPDPDLDPTRPILLAGHQPQLFHPGVWFKNLVLSELAQPLDGYAVNLVIDNDLCRSNSIAVPTRHPDGPWVQPVALDRPEANNARNVPFEARDIGDSDFFQSLDERVGEVLHAGLPDPLIKPLWKHVRRSADRTGNLGLAIAQGRHALEGELGWNTLELPLSLAVESNVFRAFVTYLCRHADKLHPIYNDVRQQYRATHRIRSQAHPVPALSRRGDWFEMPLWVWHRDDPRRRPLFAQPHQSGVTLWDGEQDELRLTIEQEDAIPHAALEQLAAWSQGGICVRPRALTTTLYARLMLGDLFLHGIGGAKYDQLTDAIMMRWLGLRPPAIAVTSATVQLPLDLPGVTPADIQHVTGLLRELRYHPEKHVPDPDAVGEAIAEKQQWIERVSSSLRHEAIERVNQSLQPLVEPQRQLLLAEREQLRQQLRKTNRLGSREFAFCLFPESGLPDFLLELLKKEL